MAKIPERAHLNLLKHLNALARAVGQLEVRLCSKVRADWQMELAILCQQDVASSKQDEYPLERQLLLQVLTYKLAVLKLSTKDWPDYFLREAYRTELELSLWGIYLLFYTNRYGFHMLVDHQISQFPKCLLPMNCVICDRDLGITPGTYNQFKQGSGKVLCDQCAQYRTDKASFMKKEELPVFMGEYKTLKANQWTRKVQNGMFKLDRATKQGLNKNAQRREEVALAITDAYAFYLSQYAHRTYRPRYQVLHSYPCDWILHILFYISLNKHVYLKMNASYQPQPFQSQVLSGEPIVVEVPPIFTADIEQKPIAMVKNPKFIVLEDLDQYLV